MSVEDGGARRRRWSKSLVLAGVIVLVAAWLAIDAFLYPWARSLTGAPTLVGVWHGELTTPSGRRQWIALDIDAWLGRCTSCQRIEASARVCDARGMREYEGRGNTENWRGTKFLVGLFAKDERREGLGLIKLDGAWNEDIVHATVSFESGHSASISTDRTGAVSRPGADPDTLSPVTFTLRRGSERDFQTACKKLLS